MTTPPPWTPAPPPWTPAPSAGPASGSPGTPNPLAAAALVVGVIALVLSALWSFGAPVAFGLLYTRLHWSISGWDVAWHGWLVVQILLGVAAAALGVVGSVRSRWTSGRSALGAALGIALALEAIVSLIATTVAGSIR